MLVLLVAFFELILAIYMLAIIRNGHEHMARNLENLRLCLDLPYIVPEAPALSANELSEERKKIWAAGEEVMGKIYAPQPSGVKAGVKWILALSATMDTPRKVMRILALAVGVLDLLLVIIGGVGVWQWVSGKDVPYILITPLSRI